MSINNNFIQELTQIKEQFLAGQFQNTRESLEAASQKISTSYNTPLYTANLSLIKEVTHCIESKTDQLNHEELLALTEKVEQAVKTPDSNQLKAVQTDLVKFLNMPRVTTKQIESINFLYNKISETRKILVQQALETDQEKEIFFTTILPCIDTINQINSLRDQHQDIQSCIPKLAKITALDQKVVTSCRETSLKLAADIQAETSSLPKLFSKLEKDHQIGIRGQLARFAKDEKEKRLIPFAFDLTHSPFTTQQLLLAIRNYALETVGHDAPFIQLHLLEACYLPNEIWHKIFGHLEETDLSNVSQVCHTFNVLSSHSRYWKPRLETVSHFLIGTDSAFSAHLSTKQLYKKICKEMVKLALANQKMMIEFRNPYSTMCGASIAPVFSEDLIAQLNDKKVPLGQKVYLIKGYLNAEEPSTKNHLLNLLEKNRVKDNLPALKLMLQLGVDPNPSCPDRRFNKFFDECLFPTWQFPALPPKCDTVLGRMEYWGQTEAAELLKKFGAKDTLQEPI